MKIEEINNSINQIWDSIAPSVFRVIVILICVNVFFPLFDLFSHIRPVIDQITTELSTPEVKETLTFYGIDKLFPLIIIFTLLLSFSLINRVVFLVSNLIPIQVSVSEYSMFIRNETIDSLAIIWAKYPNVKYPYELYELVDYLADKEITNMPKLGRKGIDYYDERVSNTYTTASFLKFLNFWFLLMGIIYLFQPNSSFSFFVANYLFFLLDLLQKSV